MFDPPPGIDENDPVRRVMLFAIGVCVLLWTLVLGAGSAAPPDIPTMSGVDASLRVDAPPPSSDTDEQWRAPQTIVPGTASVWTSELAHAELAATPSPRVFDRRASTSPDPPARSAPPYLLHTPLLI